MNFNLKLTEASLFVLLTFSAVFGVGYQQGISHAEKSTADAGVTCLPPVASTERKG